MATRERLSFALKQLKSTDWKYFEEFASAFLVCDYPNLRTMAQPDDGGRDSELFSSNGDTRVVFQYSVTESWSSKIKGTAKRLNEYFSQSPITMFIYVTNQNIGAKADDLKKEIYRDYKYFVDIYDESWFLDRLSGKRCELAEQLAHQFVDPLIKSENLQSAGITSLEGEELQIAHLFLSLHSEDQKQDRNLTKKVYESIALSILRKTDSNNRLDRTSIHNAAIRLLAEHPASTIITYIDNALVRLDKRMIRHWRKDDTFCLSNETIQELSTRASQSEVTLSTMRSIICTNIPQEIQVTSCFPEKILKIIEDYLYAQGELFSLAIADGKQIELSREEIKIIVTKHIQAITQEFINKLTVDQINRIVFYCVQSVLHSDRFDVKSFLRTRANSYITMAFLKKTPNVKNVCKKIMKGEVWIDTCVILPLIAENVFQDDQKTYLKVIEQAQKNDMQLYVSGNVINEVLSHIDRCLTFESYLYNKSLASWVGDIPILYSAFYENNEYDITFQEWIYNIKGDVDAQDNLKQFLSDELGIVYKELIYNSEDFPYYDKIKNVWEEAHKNRAKRRGLPINSENIDKLTAGDVSNYLGVISLRNQCPPDGLGYKHWWLTLDQTAYKIPAMLKEENPRWTHTSPAMGIDFLANYVSFCDAGACDTPVTMDSVLLPYLTIDILAEAEKVRDKLNGKPPSLIRRTIKDKIHQLKAEKGFHGANIFYHPPDIEG